MRYFTISILIVGLFIVLGCGGGGSDKTQIPQKYQGNWTLNEHIDGTAQCAGEEPEEYEMDFQVTYAIGPDSIQQNGYGAAWAWDGDDIAIVFKYTTSYDDPDCGHSIMTWDYNYKIHFNEAGDHADITGTLKFSWDDDCDDCWVSFDISGEMDRS